MNLLRIEYFVEVARCENFTEAARNLFTSQPNLSKQISLMEQELGFALFQRVGRSIHLTQAGRYLYSRFKDIPSSTAQAIAHARALSRGDVGSLTVGILEGQDLNRTLTERLDRFRQQYPDVTLELERSSFSALRRNLANCRCDLILTLSFEVDESDPSLRSRTIMPQPNGVIAINRRNPKSGLRDLSLADLAGEPFVSISPEESPRGYAQLVAQCRDAGFAPNIVRLANTLESLLLCVETDIGIAMVDHNTRLQHSENVRTIPVPGSADANLVAVWNAENSNPVVQHLVHCLEAI